MHHIYRSAVSHLCRALIIALAVVAVADAASLSERRGERRAARDRAKSQEVETPLTVGSFSHTVTLDGEAGAVLSYTLPEAVHSWMQRRDFTDLCVFDSEGMPVPFQLLTPQGKNAAFTVEAELPHFLWQPEKPEAATPGMMDIEINAHGGIVRIKGQTDDLARPGPVSYLLDMQAFYDASAAPAAPGGEVFSAGDIRERAFTVHLGGDEPFMASVSMKTSDDLNAWTSLGKPQMIVRTRQGDITLERENLELPRTAKRYLLLQFADSDIPVFSFSAKAVFDKTTFEVRETIVHGALSENKRVASYTLPGRFPLQAIGFNLPQADMMAVRLAGTDDRERPFTPFAQGFIYRLEKDGAMLTGEPFPVTESRHYWNLYAAGDIPFATAPGMRVYWTPRNLLFLARGKGPWVLAYGRATAVQASDLPLLGHGDVKPAKETAASVPSDRGMVVPAAEPKESRAWILWAVLGLAVVFLTGVTLWLVRSMKN